MDKTIFPENFRDILSNFDRDSQNKIKEEYKKLYEKDSETFRKRIKLELDSDISDTRTHEILRSYSLIPFLHQEVNNYELLLIEPLSIYKYKNKIEKLPIFDFLLIEFDDDKVKCLVFGEVKGGERVVNIGDLENFEEIYEDPLVRKEIYDYIRKVKPTAIIDEINIIFHFVSSI